MKIIVTGGAGFLGSNLCDKLIAQNHQVICIDNLLTGTLENIKHLQSNSNFQFLKWDVVNKLPEMDVDQIYHLASPASPNFNSSKSYHALAFETMSVNTTGTWNLAEYAVNHQIRFLFTSTSEIYGDPLVHPQTEDYRGNVSTIGPRAVYDEAKRFGETIISAFIRSKGLDGRIVRIFNTYGPRMALDDGRVVIEFMLAAMKNKPFPIFGSGEQSRSFCYVDDLVEGLILTMNTENIKGEVFNLGNPDEFTILQLAEKIKFITNSSSQIKTVADLPQDDPLKRRPDITKAQQILGWSVKVKLDEGLTKLHEHLKSTGIE